MSALTSHRNVQRSPLGTCTGEWHLLCHSTLQSCPDTQGKLFQTLPTACQHNALWLQKQERIDLLIGGDRQGAGTGSAGVVSIQAGGQHVAIFTHFTELPCTVVPAVLKGRILQLMAAYFWQHKKTSLGYGHGNEGNWSNCSLYIYFTEWLLSLWENLLYKCQWCHRSSLHGLCSYMVSISFARSGKIPLHTPAVGTET